MILNINYLPQTPLLCFSNMNILTMLLSVGSPTVVSIFRRNSSAFCLSRATFVNILHNQYDGQSSKNIFAQFMNN